MNSRENYIVMFKDSLILELYSSLEAIFLAHSKEEIGRAKVTLQRFDFSKSPFENQKVKIVKTKPKTTNDVRKELNIIKT
jgi:hypothetical protein